MEFRLMTSATYMAAYGQKDGPSSSATCRTFLACSLTIPTILIRAIKQFDLGTQPEVAGKLD
eukprot:1216013-Prorocentrum_lima.AAC.1